MKTIAVIGAGMSGLAVAHCLKEHFQVNVFEADTRAGGLIKCDRTGGHLYHKVGGHVFNSRRQDVLDWFWSFFDRENEFTKAERNAVVSMPGGLLLDYPVENHVYSMPPAVMKEVIKDILALAAKNDAAPENFEEFLRSRFGKTLFEIYFRPYNEKIWKTDLKNIPLSWLEGKLPMPTLDDILYNNFNRAKEANMVHSSFYYAKNNGSQFLADRLASDLNITYNRKICRIQKNGNKWSMDEKEQFDAVVFCGNIKDFPQIVSGVDMSYYAGFIEKLAYHGTTTVLCEIEPNSYSWIYLPDSSYAAHRIICTGNFALSNNANGKTGATIEFTGYLSEQDILEQLAKIPFSPTYITHSYTKYTYPVQNENTRSQVGSLQAALEKENIYLLGRFAEWEYYNMDAAIGAAMDLSEKIIKINQ